jgi:hypothetical protein
LVTSQDPNKINVYSRGVILLRAFAPTRLHKVTSSLILIENVYSGSLVPKNPSTPLLPNSHDTSIAREAKSFLDCPLF